MSQLLTVPTNRSTFTEHQTKAHNSHVPAVLYCNVPTGQTAFTTPYKSEKLHECLDGPMSPSNQTDIPFSNWPSQKFPKCPNGAKQADAYFQSTNHTKIFSQMSPLSQVPNQPSGIHFERQKPCRKCPDHLDFPINQRDIDLQNEKILSMSRMSPPSQPGRH